MVNKLQVPKWLSHYVSQPELMHIEESVKRAELLTSAEIVPMVVRRSTLPPPVFMIVALFLMLVLSAVNAWNWQMLRFGDAWLPYLAVLDALLIIGTAAMLARLPYLQFLLTPRGHMVRSAELRAENEFYAAGLNKTDGGTGILIFISIFEHRAIILADKSIAEKLPPATWDHIIASLLGKIKNKKFAEGMMDAVNQCAEIAAKHFPPTEHDTDELLNHLIIKD
jgi:putative membrane protein